VGIEPTIEGLWRGSNPSQSSSGVVFAFQLPISWKSRNSTRFSLLHLSSERFAILTSKTTIFPGRAGGDRTHDRGIVRWMRTVRMVSWCRYRLESSGIPVLWCRSRLVELDRYVGFSVGFSATVSARRAGSRRRADVSNPTGGLRRQRRSERCISGAIWDAPNQRSARIQDVRSY
jgi:hypothetical protein